jgi:hypothetical protein
VASLSAEQLLEIVRVLDDQMNNTSLILLLEVGKKKLLFPGDAQIENWSWALQDAPDAKRTRELLSAVDFYKVGHHDSRNATPKTLLWDKFAKRNRANGRLKTALSTMQGKHGTPAKKTEVPRKTLLEALENESDLLNTENHKPAPNEDPCQLIKITMTDFCPRDGVHRAVPREPLDTRHDLPEQRPCQVAARGVAELVSDSG